MSKRYGIWTVGVALLVCASSAAALSLGRARGAVLLGRSLDLVVQTTLEAQELLPEAACLAVDVFYGDSRISPNAVSIGAERSAAGQAQIRVRATPAVDEPVVTLYLRSTCGVLVSRRYVLLADTLTEADLPASASGAGTLPVQIPRIAALPAAQSALGRVSNAPAATTAGAETAVATLGSAAERAAVRKSRRQEQRLERARLAQERIAQRTESATNVQSIAQPARAPSRSIMRPAGTQKTSGPRLRVDLLDLASFEPSLRGSAELASAPSSDAAVRSQAQALWRSLNASPEDAMRDELRLGALETQIKASLEQSKRQGQDIATLSTQLQASQQARYLNPFTLFLGVLTLIALALSAWLWRRSASANQPWYRAHAQQAPKDEAHLWGHLAEELGAPPPAPSAHPAPTDTNAAHNSAHNPAHNPAQALPQSKPELRFTERAIQPIDFSLPSALIGLSTAKIKPLGSSAGAGRGGSMGRVDSTPPPSLLPAKQASASRNSFGHTDFGQSGFANSRLVAAEELFDIQEQADFFMSLNQPDQAIEVLKNHITDNVETSALAYMDLFDIYHRTARTQDYNQLREEFNRVFNAQAPNFDSHGQQANGLEAYPQALQGIQRYWPGPQTLEVIEESIFRQPDSQTPPFDMPAYRELMLLYTLAKELNKPGAAFAPVQAFAPMAGLSSAGWVQLEGGPQSDPLGQPGLRDSAAEGLGFDLSFSEPSATPMMDDYAISSDSTARLPVMPVGLDNTLDFDLSDTDKSAASRRVK